VEFAAVFFGLAKRLRGKSASTPPNDFIAARSGVLPRPKNISLMIHE